jgi:hypothetical protein
MTSNILILPENINELKETNKVNKPNLNDLNTFKFIGKFLNQYISEFEVTKLKILFGI